MDEPSERICGVDGEVPHLVDASLCDAQFGIGGREWGPFGVGIVVNRRRRFPAMLYEHMRVHVGQKLKMNIG